MEPRLDDLESKLAALDERLARVEAALAGAAPAGETQPAQPLPPVRRVPTEAPPAPPTPPPAPPREPVSLEELLGGRVLAWVGGAAVVLGVAFFLVMAVSRGWIDEATRTLLALAGSTALLVVSLYLHERAGRTQAALAAAATSIAALYVTLVAATQLYDLVEPVLGLAFAGLVGATATVLAVRWEQPVVAGIGLGGALLAPVLVDAGAGGAALAFVVVALVATVGVLLWQRWSWLGGLAFLVTAPQLVAWLVDDHALGLELAVLAGLWLLFVAAAIGYELRVPVAHLRLTSASLLLANAALAAGAGWAMLDEAGWPGGATAWVLAGAAVHVGAGVPAYRGRMSPEIAALIVAVGTALAAVGLALALDGPALVAGWAAEAVVLAYAARRLGDGRGHVLAAIFFGLAVVLTLASEAPPEGLRTGLDPFAPAAIAVALTGVAAALLARLTPDVEDSDLRPAVVYLAIASAAAIYLPSLAIVAAFGEGGDAGQTPQVLLSAFWALTGLAGLVVGLLRDVRPLRLGAFVLLGLAVAKVFAYDLAELESIYRAVSFIALGLLLLGAAFAYQRIRRELRQ